MRMAAATSCNDDHRIHETDRSRRDRRLVRASSVGATMRATTAVFDLVKMLAGHAGILAGNAGAAEAIGRKTDGPRNRLDGQVAQAVGTELLGHTLLRFRRDTAIDLVDIGSGKELILSATCRCRNSMAR